jgi:hypothetical protein
MGNGCGFSILIKQWANIWHHFTISKVFWCCSTEGANLFGSKLEWQMPLLILNRCRALFHTLERPPIAERRR